MPEKDAKAGEARAHIPIRTCLVCMRKRPRRELIRLVLEPGDTGRIVLDPKQAMTGRGGYTCPECIRNFRLNKRVQRAFRGAARELRLEMT